MSLIGVFDSGVGGLTILSELTRLMPEVGYHYVADSGFAPYGERSKEYIIDRSERISGFLISQGCDMIVVACNTATGAAISTLRQHFRVPFDGVEPAVKPAAMESLTGHIGVLATRQTFQGEHFQKTSGRFAAQVEVHVQPGDGLVELIESGMADSEEVQELLKRYIGHLTEKDIDQLVLGCTHYPMLIPHIRQFLPEGIILHDPSPAVARQTLKMLDSLATEAAGENKQGISFYTTGIPEILERMVRQIWKKPYQVQQLEI